MSGTILKSHLPTYWPYPSLAPNPDLLAYISLMYTLIKTAQKFRGQKTFTPGPQLLDYDDCVACALDSVWQVNCWMVTVMGHLVVCHNLSQDTNSIIPLCTCWPRIPGFSLANDRCMSVDIHLVRGVYCVWLGELVNRYPTWFTRIWWHESISDITHWVLYLVQSVTT